MFIGRVVFCIKCSKKLCAMAPGRSDGTWVAVSVGSAPRRLRPTPRLLVGYPVYGYLKLAYCALHINDLQALHGAIELHGRR